MYFGQNIDEELDVIGTDNFIDYVRTMISSADVPSYPGALPTLFFKITI